ncbi:MAG: hypothetical protein M3256_23965 [Actinomycetota bacterium]|nr:hypothetical protein [Actinomycetota bacterium]
MSDPRFVRDSALIEIGVDPGLQPEPTAAAVDELVLYTASKWHAVSTDGGASFSNPWTFNGTVFGGDNKKHVPWGDESVIFAAGSNRFIWAMLYKEDVDGRFTLRVAFSGPKEVSSGAAAWAYMDFDAEAFGRLGYSFDYPQLAVTLSHAYVTASLVGPEDRRSQIVLRFPMHAFRSLEAHQVGLEYIIDDSPHFFGPVQSCISRFHWGQQVDLGTFRIWSWNEASGEITKSDISIPRWNDGDYSTKTRDGYDWLDHCAPRPVGTELFDGEVVFAWSAGRPTDGLHPFPYVYLLHLRPVGDGFVRAGVRYLWNRSFAFALPSLATIGGRVAVNCALGGPVNYPTPAMGFVEVPLHDSSVLTLVSPARSDVGATRWGDYITIRPWFRSGDRDLLAATAYTVHAEEPLPSHKRHYTPRFYGFS